MAAALLTLAAAAFAGGADEGTQAAGEAQPEAMAAGSGMTFDHEWDSLRTFVTVSEYTRQTGNAVGEYHEAPELAARVADGSLEPVADRLPDDPAGRPAARSPVEPGAARVYDQRPYRIRLSAREAYWCQYAYQFAHELATS